MRFKPPGGSGSNRQRAGKLCALLRPGAGSGPEDMRAMRENRPIDTAAAIKVATLREALRAFMRESELNVQANGLTPQRYLLLLMIKGAADGSERSTVTELAARLRLAQNTVTDLVKRAEDAGLITRERSECGRPRSDPPPHCERRATARALLPR